MTIIKIAWRNLYRNPGRSLVIMAAMALGLFVGVWSTALFKGMTDQRIKAGIELEMGHIQIHAPGYLDNPEVTNYIDDAERVVDQLSHWQEIAGVSPRLVAQAMIASAETSAGVRLTGIDPTREAKVTDIHSRIVQGKYPEPAVRNRILIGSKLARKLKVKLKSRVVLTFQDTAGNLMSSAFRVYGIYQTDNDMFDEQNVFILRNELSQLTGLPPHAAHEIVIKAETGEQVSHVLQQIKKRWPELESRSWDELSPELAYLVSAMDQYMYVIIIVILLALGFGIVNTMLMAVLERTREIGMLMAIGMTQSRIFRMIMWETILLVLTGALTGLALAIPLVLYNQTHGLHLQAYAEGFRSLGYSPVMYTTFDIVQILNVILLVVLTGLLAAIYPARQALKLKPAQALRTD